MNLNLRNVTIIKKVHLLKTVLRSGVVMHTFNTSTQEAEVDGAL